MSDISIRGEWEADCKSIKLKLPNNEQIILEIPIRAREEHLKFLLNKRSNPDFEGNDVDTLREEYPELTRWEAIKIESLFYLWDR